MRHGTVVRSEKWNVVRQKGASAMDELDRLKWKHAQVIWVTKGKVVFAQLKGCMMQNYTGRVAVDARVARGRQERKGGNDNRRL